MLGTPKDLSTSLAESNNFKYTTMDYQQEIFIVSSEIIRKAS